jgi:hypothetical protein
MKSNTGSKLLRAAALGALAAFILGQPSLRAADHGDAPNLAHDQACDIADLYFFLDPNDNNMAVLMMTVRGFIVPGEAVNFAIFDPNVLYRFNIENTGDELVDKTIDVRFSPRVASVAPDTAPGFEIFQVPDAQEVHIKFSDIANPVTHDSNGVPIHATKPSLGPTAPTQEIFTAPLRSDKTFQFFAGEVDDPFFFDIPAFSRYVTSLRTGRPNPKVFDRGRDSFAGYNILCIAFRLPASYLLNKTPGAPTPSIIGAYCETKRRVVQIPNPKNGAIRSAGTFKTIDRMAVPAVNVALIPFNRKNEYNQGTPRKDAALIFAGDILKTLAAFGTPGATDFPPTSTALILAQTAVLNGDYLRLETNAALRPNEGLGGGEGPGGFTNGRRLRDDVVDILLNFITNSAIGDNVSANDVPLQDAFPFVAPSQQPRNPANPNGPDAPADRPKVIDNTQN